VHTTSQYLLHAIQREKAEHSAQVPSKINMRREKMDAKFLGFVATLTPRPELVKMLRETVESVWVERYREVDARLSKLQETISDLRKRRTKLYQAHIEDRVPWTCSWN
jgi:hypothetical protein